ncbi:MAG: inner-rane translocator, partial [Variovorax sp.]|nr:inner-rane translocator [Variovorax sp.]
MSALPSTVASSAGAVSPRVPTAPPLSPVIPAPAMAAPSLPSAGFKWRDLRGAAVLLAVAIALPFFVSDYRIFQATMTLIMAIAVLGLNMLVGYNGQLSLGHGAIYALGAYTAAVLIEHAGFPWWATLPVAGLV